MSETLPKIQAQFRVECEGGIVGTTEAPIYSSNLEDDGSITVTIDHWPERKPADFLDTPLPEPLRVGHVVFGKGVKLRTLVHRMETLYNMMAQKYTVGSEEWKKLFDQSSQSEGN